MNLQKLFELQRQLDEHIMDEHPELRGQDNLPWKVLALQVELGECANEWRGFKKWSHDQEPRNLGDPLPCEHCEGAGRDGYEPLANCWYCGGTGISEKRNISPLLEEYVDGLHFVLSIGLELKEHNFDWFREYEANKMPGWYLSDTITEQFNSVFFFVSYLLNNTDDYSRDLYGDVICYYLGLGEMLGFTWEQIEEAYMRKNAVNHQRQERGY